MARIRSIPIVDIPNEQSYGTRYLYVVAEAGTVAPIKIGRADNPIWRRSSLQAGNHRTLVLLGAWVGDRGDIIRLELRLHAHFEPHRLAREWFSVPFDEVSALMERVYG